jgi:hypothetical protein
LALLARAHARRTPQEAIPFERTTRYLRGRIVDCLRDVPAGAALAVEDLVAALTAIVPSDRIDEIPTVVDALVREGIVARTAGALALA